MENIDKYNSIFMKIFNISLEQLFDLKFKSIEAWDSVGHMQLIAAIEDTFHIVIDTDDIIAFSSYEKGKEILAKSDYGVFF